MHQSIPPTPGGLWGFCTYFRAGYRNCTISIVQGLPRDRTYIISLITGWTVYTEKYKAGGPDI